MHHRKSYKEGSSETFQSIVCYGTTRGFLHFISQHYTLWAMVPHLVAGFCTQLCSAHKQRLLTCKLLLLVALKKAEGAQGVSLHKTITVQSLGRRQILTFFWEMNGNFWSNTTQHRYWYSLIGHMTSLVISDNSRTRLLLLAELRLT